MLMPCARGHKRACPAVHHVGWCARRSGVSNTLSSDKDFAAFKGFDVTVTTNAEFKKKTKFEGTLVGRDAEFVTINLKGRLQKIPIELVEAVRLPTAQTEAGDPYN